MKFQAVTRKTITIRTGKTVSHVDSCKCNFKTREARAQWYSIGMAGAKPRLQADTIDVTYMKYIHT
jgi:hypothetical protein